VSKIRHIILFSLLIISSLVLTGCARSILDPAGHIASEERWLLLIAVAVMCIVVIPVIILNFVIAFRYRHSNKQAKYTPDWSHSTLLEIIIWGVPTIIILALAIIVWIYTHRLDPYKPLASKEKTLTIQVIALDWRWLFIYPEQHVASMNFMQIPLHRQIQLLITGDNSPMNSIEMPQLAGQIYSMPGMQTKLHFDAYKPGDYAGFSVNYSGDGFSGMKFTVRAGSDADFNAWVKKAQSSADKLTIDRYNQLVPPSTDTHVMLFASPDKDLYHYILNRYMPHTTPVPYHAGE
jgi:cytochrome o ubiquinol oxidase subunit 2